MKQYFDDDVKLEDKPKEFVYEFAGEKLKFKTNSGLFAKDGIDDFSAILVDVVEKTSYKNILDLGCGYGFIGIALAKVCEYDKITFIDITKRACEYTKINAELNNIENYDVIQSDGILSEESYDLITLNPPIHAGKDNIYKLYQESYNHLSATGKMYIVVHKKHGAKSTIEHLQTVFNTVKTVYKKKGLFVVELSK